MWPDTPRRLCYESIATRSVEPHSMKRKTTKLLEAIAKAKRDGWYKYLRQGEGEEADERAILAGCYFDFHRAEHWLNFADQYGTLTEGAWKGLPFRLLDWQANATARLFGWQKHSPEWGYAVRRFRYFYLEVPKKNGKTPLLSLIGNYLLFGDSWDRQINLYLAATTRKQAERCLIHAIRQIKNAPDLQEAASVKKLEGFYSIEYADNAWNVVAADPDSADGVNGHCLADEFHRWRGYEFYNSLRYMLASQPEGIFAAITTAGSDLESPCRAVHDKTKAVNAGRQIDEAHYGEIYAASPDDDPHDEATWLKANPSLGDTAEAPIKMSTFRQDYEAAKATPSEWPAFLRLRLNLWTTAEAAWLDEACPRGIYDWDSGDIERRKRNVRIDCYENFSIESLARRPPGADTDDEDEDEGDELTNANAWMGIDLASVRDTCAAVVSIRRDDGTICVVPFCWLPERQAERENKRVPYRQWSEAGHIRLTPGEVADYDVIFEDLVAIVKRFGICKFFYDDLFQATWLTQRLEDETGAQRIIFPQTIVEYGPVVKDVERLIIAHDIRHNGNPLLTWQIANAKARTNTNQDKRLVKQKQGDYRKVDLAQAMLMSLHDAVTGLEDQDWYDDPDMEVEII